MAFAGGAEAADSSLPLTQANLQQAVNTPTAQQTPAQQALVQQALQLSGTVTTTTNGLVAGQSPFAEASAATASTAVVSTDEATPAASGNTCYGGILSRTTYTLLGVSVAWTQTEVGGWCTGPGKTMIVSVDGWTFPEWIGGGMCNAYDYSTHAGEGQSDGNGHTNEAHGIHVLGVGYGVNGACPTVKTIEAALIIWYNGNASDADDWGF
jgi:hypothetical protein